jgi:hypothetical protein
MPSMSRKYCLTTSPRKMGFSQKASCKAQGLLKRTSKKNKGKYVVSPKYRRKSKRRSRKDGSLYSNGRRKPRTKTGYGDAKRARETLKNIKKFDKAYQMQVVTTMYNRAKYHANQTMDMREAMKVFRKWLKSHKRN